MPTEQEYRQNCHCEDCRKTRSAVALLDTYCTNGASEWDIELVCKARDLLAAIVGLPYNRDTNRHTAGA